MDLPKSQIGSGMRDEDWEAISSSASVLRNMLREEIRLGSRELLQQLTLIVQPVPAPVGSILKSGPRDAANTVLDLEAKNNELDHLHAQLAVQNERLRAGASTATFDSVKDLSVDVHPFAMPLSPSSTEDDSPTAGEGVPKKARRARMSVRDRQLSAINGTDAGEIPGQDDSNGPDAEEPMSPVSVVRFVEKQKQKRGSCNSSQQSSAKSKNKMMNKKKTKLFSEAKLAEGEQDLTRLQRLTSGRHYEALSGILILVNAVYIGWQTQHLAEYYRDRANNGYRYELGDSPVVFLILQISFTVLFAIELLPRWIAHGFVDFFMTDERWWNILDVIVVANGIVEAVLDIMERITQNETDNILQNVSAMRLLRIVRAVRVVRVIRVMKFFRELRMMVYSILGSLKNLLWVVIILGVTFYLFGVTFTAAVINNMEGWSLQDWNAAANHNLLESFGTVDRSALTLFMTMSGGNDWSVYYDVLTCLPIFYRWFFLGFITFTLFAIVNIVTGVFVEAAMQSNLKDRDIIAEEELQSKRKYLESMQELFEEMDDDGQGTITMDEFEGKLKDERVIAFFDALKLDVSDARVVFQLIDTDKSGDITISEFLIGCYKLQGESRSLDMKIMQFSVAQLHEMFIEVQMTLREMKSELAPPKSAPNSPKSPPKSSPNKQVVVRPNSDVLPNSVAE